MLILDPRSTALVLIDLQNGIIGAPLAPRSGPGVLACAAAFAKRFRAAGAPVVLVHFALADDYADALRQPVDQPTPLPQGGLPAGWSDLGAGLAEAGDIGITKRQWGAFYGTDMDLQLRRRGIQTIVLGGIATNFGVELTARQAWEHGYELVLAEDATSSTSAELHGFSIKYILPLIARVTQTSDIGFATA